MGLRRFSRGRLNLALAALVLALKGAHRLSFYTSRSQLRRAEPCERQESPGEPRHDRATVVRFKVVR